MNKEYNSRQKKIYQDYNVYSSDNLLDILKSNEKYNPDIIEVINDILHERNLMYASGKERETADQGNKRYEYMEPESEIINNEEKRRKDEEVKSIAKKLNEKSTDELTDIIVRYSDFQPETVEAALFLLVEKGIISYDLKEKILKQIKSNFAEQSKPYKQKKWESNNAFIQYVSRYQDDEIYKIIEDPKGMMLDVYQAILITAKKRKLISEEDFTEYYYGTEIVPKTVSEIRKEAADEIKTESFTDAIVESEADLEAEIEKYWKCPKCNELVGMEFGVCWNCQTEIPGMIIHPDKEEIRREKINETFQDSDTVDEGVSEAELEVETEKYWKCPTCNEMVGMEFGVCWNCQTEIPETFVHPDKEEVIREIKTDKSFNPVKTGLNLIVIGLLTFLLNYLIKSFDIFYVESVIIALAGLGFVIFGLVFVPKKKHNMSK